MDSSQSSHAVWRKVGIALGVVRALDSIVIGAFLTILFWSAYDGMIGIALLFLVMYALNLVASVVWLFAIFKKRSRFLLGSLIWWIIPLVISLILIISVLCAGPPNQTTEGFEKEGLAKSFNDWLKVLVILGGVLSFIFYGLALMSYLKMKEAFDGDESEIQNLGVGYTPKSKTADLNIY